MEYQFHNSVPQDTYLDPPLFILLLSKVKGILQKVTLHCDFLWFSREGRKREGESRGGGGDHEGKALLMPSGRGLTEALDKALLNG